MNSTVITKSMAEVAEFPAWYTMRRKVNAIRPVVRGAIAGTITLKYFYLESAPRNWWEEPLDQMYAQLEILQAGGGYDSCSYEIRFPLKYIDTEEYFKGVVMGGCYEIVKHRFKTISE